MILLSFMTAGRNRLGVKTSEGIVDVATAQAALGLPGRGHGHAPETMDDLLAGGESALAALSALVSRLSRLQGEHSWLLAEQELTFAPPVPPTAKLWLVGRNYAKHAAETGHTLTEHPTLFGKFANALASHGSEVPLPSTAEEYDYEAELAVIIGRAARHVSEQDALSHVLGYCCANDLSARDLQFRTSQFLFGKSLDKFLPLGPYIVTPDEVGDPQDLQIRLWLNGELRQQANTGEMVHGVAYLISYISDCIPLLPGDVICTGTPEGVIHGRQDKVWLKPGDEVTVEIEKLGRLTNRLVAES